MDRLTASDGYLCRTCAADSVRDAIQAWDETVRELWELVETIGEQLAEVWEKVCEYRPWDEIHDYDNKPPGSIGAPLARAPVPRRAAKWRINIYGRS